MNIVRYEYRVERERERERAHTQSIIVVVVVAHSPPVNNDFSNNNKYTFLDMIHDTLL
jgi:hypothetical protein